MQTGKCRKRPCCCSERLLDQVDQLRSPGGNRHDQPGRRQPVPLCPKPPTKPGPPAKVYGLGVVEETAPAAGDLREDVDMSVSTVSASPSASSVPQPTLAPACGAALGPEACAWPVCQNPAWPGAGSGGLGQPVGPANPGCHPIRATAIFRNASPGMRPCIRLCSQALEQGRLPMMLGGDHCLAISSISAVARHCRRKGQASAVLWLTPMPTSTPAITPVATSMACRWPCCADMVLSPAANDSNRRRLCLQPISA